LNSSPSYQIGMLVLVAIFLGMLAWFGFGGGASGEESAGEGNGEESSRIWKSLKLDGLVKKFREVFSQVTTKASSVGASTKQIAEGSKVE